MFPIGTSLQTLGYTLPDFIRESSMPKRKPQPRNQESFGDKLPPAERKPIIQVLDAFLAKASAE